MQQRTLPTSFLAGTLAALLLLAAALPAKAQLEVSFTLEKKTYVAHEDIVGTISVLNRAGRDVILNGPGGSWLQVTVKDPEGKILTPFSGALKAQPMVVPSGGTLVEEIVLNHHFAVGGFGRYEATAAAYFPAQKRFYESATVRFQVTEARKFWSKSVGVPSGYEGAGSVREFQLLTYQEINSSTLYVRLKDELSGGVLVTYPLGLLIPFRDPQVTVDGGNRMNVLFLTGPDAYRHVAVAPDGSLAENQDYRASAGTRPSMMIAEDGTIRIRGGAPLLADSDGVGGGSGLPGGSGGGFADPLGTGNPEASSTPAENPGGRTLSERPPGLE